MSKDKIANLFHLFDPALFIFHPSFGSKDGCIISVDRIALCPPRVETDRGSPRDPIAMDVVSLRGCDTIPKLRQWRMYAKAFLNAGLEVWQLAGLRFLDGDTYCTMINGAVNLLLKLMVNPGIGNDRKKRGLNSGRRCIGTCYTEFSSAASEVSLSSQDTQ